MFAMAENSFCAEDDKSFQCFHGWKCFFMRTERFLVFPFPRNHLNRFLVSGSWWRAWLLSSRGGRGVDAIDFIIDSCSYKNMLAAESYAHFFVSPKLQIIRPALHVCNFFWNRPSVLIDKIIRWTHCLNICVGLNRMGRAGTELSWTWFERPGLSHRTEYMHILQLFPPLNSDNFLTDVHGLIWQAIWPNLFLLQKQNKIEKNTDHSFNAPVETTVLKNFTHFCLHFPIWFWYVQVPNLQN